MDDGTGPVKLLNSPSGLKHCSKTKVWIPHPGASESNQSNLNLKDQLRDCQSREGSISRAMGHPNGDLHALMPVCDGAS